MIQDEKPTETPKVAKVETAKGAKYCATCGIPLALPGQIALMTVERDAVAQDIMLILSPLVSDVAVVGKSYGWPDVMSVVKETATEFAELKKVQENFSNMSHILTQLAEIIRGAPAPALGWEDLIESAQKLRDIAKASKDAV